MTIEQLKKQDKKHAQAIANYLIKRIETDQCLKEKIENTNKTLKGCVDYCKSEAKKQAEDGCAMILDEQVYEWAVHFFLEDTIKENSANKFATPVTTDDDIKNYNNQPSPKIKKETTKNSAKKKLVEQLPLFDFLDF